MKSGRATISSLVTACTTGTRTIGEAETAEGALFTLSLRRRGSAGVESVAYGDSAAMRPLERRQAALAGRLEGEDAHGARAARHHHPLTIHREHGARHVGARARRSPGA